MREDGPSAGTLEVVVVVVVVEDAREAGLLGRGWSKPPLPRSRLALVETEDLRLFLVVVGVAVVVVVVDISSLSELSESSESEELSDKCWSAMFSLLCGKLCGLNAWKRFKRSELDKSGQLQKDTLADPHANPPQLPGVSL